MKFQPRKALTDIHTGPVFIQNNVSLSGKSKIEAYNIPFLRLQLQVSHSDGKPEMSRTKITVVTLLNENATMHYNDPHYEIHYIVICFSFSICPSNRHDDNN